MCLIKWCWIATNTEVNTVSSNRDTYTLDLCSEDNRGLRPNFLMDRTEFVLHVSDMSEIINVEASVVSASPFPRRGWAKTIFDLGVKQMFHAVTLQRDLIFLIDSLGCKYVRLYCFKLIIWTDCAVRLQSTCCFRGYVNRRHYYRKLC